MKWQPIETAPKDKLIVLAPTPWGPQVGQWRDMRSYGCGWVVCDHQCSDYYIEPAITHWSPIPDEDIPL